MANHPDKQYDPLMVLTKCTRCDTQVGERVEDLLLATHRLSALTTRCRFPWTIPFPVSAQLQSPSQILGNWVARNKFASADNARIHLGSPRTATGDELLQEVLNLSQKFTRAELRNHLETHVRADRKSGFGADRTITLADWTAEKCTRRLMSLGQDNGLWSAGCLAYDVPEDKIGVGQPRVDLQQDYVREEVDMFANELSPDLLRGESQEAPLTPRRGHIPGAFDEYIWSDTELEDGDEPERKPKSQNTDISSQPSLSVEGTQIGADRLPEEEAQTYVLQLATKHPLLADFLTGLSMRKRGDDAEMEKLSEQLSKQEERLLSKDEEISRLRREVRSLRSQLIESLKTQIYVQNHSWHLTETVKDQYDSLISTQRGDIQPLIDKLCQRLAEQEQEIALLRPLQPKLLEHLDTIVSSAGTWWGEVSGKGRKVVEAVKMLQRCYNTRSSLMSATSVGEEGLSASEPQPYQLLQDLAKANKELQAALNIGTDQEHVANMAAARVSHAREALREMQQDVVAMFVKFEEGKEIKTRLDADEEKF